MEVLHGVDVRVVGHHEDGLLGGVVRAGEGDDLLALVVDRVGGKDGVHLVVLQDALTGVGGDLRDLLRVLVAQDVAREQLGEARVEATRLAVHLVEQREEHRGLDAADAHGAGLLDLGGPLAGGDLLVGGHGTGGDERVVGLGVELGLLGGLVVGAGGRGVRALARVAGGEAEGRERGGAEAEGLATAEHEVVDGHPAFLSLGFRSAYF